MIKYPILKDNFTVGVTAPSSGIDSNLHHLIDLIREKFEPENPLIIGDTTFLQHKAKSADAKTRANELNEFLQNEDVDIIIPPWGGELAIEVLDKIDYETLQNQWILGYSDISTILLAITLKTGIATAHGTNLVDLRGKYSDDTTAKWLTVLNTKTGEEVVQYSSKMFQSQWGHANPSDYVYNFDKKTEWKAVNSQYIKIEGRLLGGCIDVIRHLVGTPYGDVTQFRDDYLEGEPVIWYLENCELSPADFRRSLVQLKYAGWFDNCAGILFGRTPVNFDSNGYTIEDVYQDLFNDLEIPIIYDIDCGHQPPQITLINGAYGIVEFEDGKGIITQKFI
ncbi:S66 family peptidase [Macrococcus capreoli]|uniref:S66 family peptidase n=1 Tax=Macrococcus capreoli TaxID=2982690 RepID=UPI0021D573FE|nr:S66 peptidase family protein [Macrococcus sp. TMW 2.2395]MCU7558463.1 LD-carboxypeptidase [Macrococcus sp. TMW 2.2395]